jgi:hypothetical protein
MSSLISSQKHGGAGHSRLSDNSKDSFKPARRSVILGCRTAEFLLLSLFLLRGSAAVSTQGDTAVSSAVFAAAERCSRKLKSLEDFSLKHKSERKQITRFTEDEVNSYLALDLSEQYNPCLKSLRIAFEENKIQAVAAIDFDRLRTESTRLLPKVISLMFSGTHTLTARGQLLSKNGNANFHLEEARFDNSTLPRSLVEEIITAVGRKQNPPFDPLQPSKMPYKIEKVDVRRGYIIVYQ